MKLLSGPCAHSALRHRSARLSIAMLACVFVGAAGCRNNTSNQDAYIRELRLHEDHIYELQANVSEYQELLRCQRLENQRLRERLASGKAEAKAENAEEKQEVKQLERIDRSLLDRPNNQSTEPDPTLPDIDGGEPELPEIDLGEPVPGGEIDHDVEELPSGEVAEVEVLSSNDRASHTRLASAAFEPAPEPTDPATSCAIYAEQLPLEPGATEETGNTIGVMAIVEPLTAKGANGYFAGEASLMLVDPLASDEEWELARWDYTAEEVEQAWRDSSRRVLDLPLAVPASTPRGRPLELWVRLVSSEGDVKILCSTAVTLAEPVAMIGVPVSGAASSGDPNVVVTSGWAAADDFADPQQNAPKKSLANWQVAKTIPPAAIAKAEAKDRKSSSRTAKRSAGWSPFR
jgi:hypothetical protein